MTQITVTPGQFFAAQKQKVAAAAIANEMSRLLAYPESDAETLPAIYRLAVENLTKAGEQ